MNASNDGRSASKRPVATGLAGARFGVLIGCTAWIGILGLLCLGTGRFELLWSVVVPLLLASLALGMLVLAAVEPVLRAAPERQAKLRLPMVFGAVFCVAGVLLLLAEAFVVPVLQQDRELAGIVRSTGGVIALPRWVAVALLVAGIVTLTRVMARAGANEQDG